MKQILVYIFLLCLFPQCKQRSSGELSKSIFADTPVSVTIKAGAIDETSGIADSRAVAGHLWVEQDSGNPPELSLLAYDGNLLKKIFIKGCENRDWEDIAVAKGPDANAYYVYIADIGDNFLQYDNYYIYRFKEPTVSTDTISMFEKLIFKYPDGSNNAEAIIVDNDLKDIYIITKSTVKTNVYKIAYPQTTTATMEARLITSLPFTTVVSAGISADGREIVIKTYTEIYYWKRTGTQTIEDVLKTSPATLKYKLEIQGEAFCFRNDNTGFYTLSEKPAISGAVDLNFYKRQ